MSTLPRLEAVICDAGGTLIRVDFEWIARDLEKHGFPTDAAALRRAEIAGRRAYDASIAAAPSDAPQPRGDQRAYWGGTLEAAGVPEALRAAAIDRLIACEKDRGLWIRPMEGAREALDALAAMGLRLGVVSNSDGRAAFHLENADMRRGVEFVVDSHLVGIEKPDPAIFRVALGRLGTLPERTLFVGDIRSIDEAGARAAEMPFVLLDPYGDYAAPDSPRIAGMHELAGWVEKNFAVISGPPTRSPAASQRRVE
jgi:putative hydrolase of the HAD superfamily